MPVNPDEPAPSAWVTRFGGRIAAGSTILDVACGSGRHANWFAAHGFEVNAVDRDPQSKLSAQIAFKQADIEKDAWPYPGQSFAGVIVTNYLHRPLLETLVHTVAPGGWLIYETFAAGNEKYGRPSRADFLLQPGELLDTVCGRLYVVAYENDYVDQPRPAVVQRIAARFGAPPDTHGTP
ncbi:MAG: class I SAM-dependent methyltransferase [Betaproteobacteria bacterium]